MLSQITFILSLALLATGSNQLTGTWRYEGQFIVGNPTLSWEMAGWKLIMGVVIGSPKANSSEVSVNFINPLVLAINDRVPEKSAWTQINKMSWMQSEISDLKKPFTVYFKKNVVESILYDKQEAKHSVDIKLAFAHHIQAALMDKEVMNKTKSYMGNCETKLSMKNNSHLKDGAPKGRVLETTYYHCDNAQWPIVGVIPKVPSCVNCESYPWKLPLESSTKVEVGRVDKKIISVLRQDVVVLPIYQTDSPQYSIYGNLSLIRVEPTEEIKVSDVNASGKINRTWIHHLNETSYLHSYGKYQAKHKVLSDDKIVKEAVRIIHTIIRTGGHARVGDNIYALYDLLSENGDAIPRIEKALTSKDEWQVLYSFLITQESPLALETLMKAVQNGKIPTAAVPAIMILSAKVTALTDVSAVCKFIGSIQQSCHFCADVSYLALSIIVRRNGKYMPSNLNHLNCLPTEPRWLLAVEGNTGLSQNMTIPKTNVLLKVAYVQSKRSLRVPTPSVQKQLIEILMDPKEELVVRIEAFKVIMGLTCDKVVWSSIFARFNEIEDEALLTFMISHLETLASIKLPVYSFTSKLAQKWLPVLKVKKSPIQFSQSLGFSTYDASSNMGVAVFADYAVPQKSWEKYMTVSLEVQPYVLNSLLSSLKIQAILPKKEMIVLIEVLRTLKMKVVPVQVILKKLSPIVMDILKKGEVKIFNDDMEILIINRQSKIMSWIRSVTQMLHMTGTIRSCIVPVVVKKTIPSPLGPRVVMSFVNYVSLDTAYEILSSPSWSVSVIPKLTAGMRFRLQAANKIAMDVGTQLRAEFETNKIKAVVKKEGSTLRLVTFMALQTTPVLSLQVIPSTDSEMGDPTKSWEQQTAPSMWAKMVPISWVLSLEEPAIAINVSGLVAKPLNQRWWFALQNPQLVQLYVLPTYKLPSDIIVAEWAVSTSKCPTTRYCSWKSAALAEKVKWCQKVCINAYNTEESTLTQGAAIAVAQMTSSLIVESRVNVTDCDHCIFTANLKWNLPALVSPVDLFNKEYIRMLKKHVMTSLPSIGVTQKETEVTKQLEQIRSALFLIENREEDYNDMLMDIMNLYPHLYVNDTLKIKDLHSVMKTLIIISTKALQSRGQRYTPDWNEIEEVKQKLLVILKTPLQKDLPEVVIMQDHVILWCVTKYIEVVHDWYSACGNCAKGIELISSFKTTLFKTWKIFYDKSKDVVNLNVLSTEIFSADKIMIDLVDYVQSAPILNQYDALEKILEIIKNKLEQLSWSEKAMAAKTVMVKLVGFELLKTMGDHCQVWDDKKVLKVKKAKTDLQISFLSVTARVFIQVTELLAGKKELPIDVNTLVNQAIQLIDYRRWLRESLIDNSELPKLKEATKILLEKTSTSLEILSRLPVNITLDPMWNLFVTGVMAVHRLTIVELQHVPRYALYEHTKVELDEMEWKLTALWKTLFGSNRPLSTLKRGLLKTPELWLQSSSKSSNVASPLKIEASIQWMNLTVSTTIEARKSDSQVIREIQETTLSKSRSMMEHLQKHIMNVPHLWLDPLFWELNLYQDISAWVSVEGKIPACMKTRVPSWIEELKTLVLPFESALSAEEWRMVRDNCQSDACVRAVISRDNKKVDLLWVDSLEVMEVIQLPTPLKWW